MFQRKTHLNGIFTMKGLLFFYGGERISSLIPLYFYRGIRLMIFYNRARLCSLLNSSSCGLGTILSSAYHSRTSFTCSGSIIAVYLIVPRSRFRLSISSPQINRNICSCFDRTINKSTV